MVVFIVVFGVDVGVCWRCWCLIVVCGRCCGCVCMWLCAGCDCVSSYCLCVGVAGARVWCRC